MRRRPQPRRTLAARGVAALVYAAAIAWLASPTWRSPSPQAPPAGVERPAAGPTRIAVGLIAPTAALPSALPAQQTGAGTGTVAATGSSVPATGSSGSSTPSPQPSQPSQPSSSGGGTSKPAKQVVGFEG